LGCLGDLVAIWIAIVFSRDGLVLLQDAKRLDNVIDSDDGACSSNASTAMEDYLSTCLVIGFLFGTLLGRTVGPM
jgi:hypothetical protein